MPAKKSSKKTSKTMHGGARKGSGPKFHTLKLSVAESLLIVDAFNGTFTDDFKNFAKPGELIVAEIEDAIKLDHLDQKWEVDGAELVRKLQKLDKDQSLDLLEKIKQFWGSEYHVADGNKRVKDIGMATE